MTRRKDVWRTVTALGLAGLTAGCFSMGPKPFERPVGAAGLRTIAAPAPVVEAAEAAEATLAVAAAPTEATPERTDVQGAGDGSMKLDVVTIRAKDIPRRAPNYSPEQTASMVCLSQRMGFNGENALRAHAATVEAKAMREALAAGTVTLKQSDQAELKRQSAVRSFNMPLPLVGALFSYDRKDDLPEPRSGAVVIENPDLFTFVENGKPGMAVSGVIRNTGATVAELPPLTMSAIDEWDFVLAGQTSLLPWQNLAPGEAHPFEMRFLNPPEYTAEVHVSFAPPFRYRSRRDCDFFDPATFDADALAATADEADPSTPPLSDAATPYIASELNNLTQYFRRESAAAWRCRDASVVGCEWAARTLHWRDMFEIAEAVDAAWIALRAGEETRNRVQAGRASESELAEALAASERAQQAFIRMGDRALIRAGASAPDTAVEVTRSAHSGDKTGQRIEIAGVIRNTGAEARTIDALMLAFVDRRDLPLSSVALDYKVTLAPGASATFEHVISAAPASDLFGIEIRLGGPRSNASPARIPYTVPWQVRVGAMAR